MPRLHTTDKAIIDACKTGEGCIEITSKEQFMRMAEAAMKVKDVFDVQAVRIVDEKRAKEVRQLRVDEGCSWRAVAQSCYDSWQPQGDDTWEPHSNQLMGRALCETAAGLLGEDPEQEPWN
jgi:hypothetical protein